MPLNQEQLNKLRTILVNKQKATNTPVDISGAEGESDPGYLSRVGGAYKEAGQDVVKGVEQGASELEEAAKGNRNPLQVAGSLLRTGLRTVGGVAKAAFAPITEAPGIKQGLEVTGKGIASIPGVEGAIGKLSELSQKYPEQAKDLEDVVNILTLGAGSAVEKPIVSAGTRAAENVLTRSGQTLKTIGEKATGLSVAASEPTKIALQAYEATQPSLLGRVKNFIMDTAEGVKPITEANTAVRKGLAGTEWQLGVQAKKISQDIWQNNIDPALSAAKDTIIKNDFFNTIKKRIISENSDLVRRKTLLNAFESFAEDYAKVSSFQAKKLQAYKEGWAKFVPEKAYKGNPIAGALNEVRNLAAQEARKIIYDKLGPELKTAYLDYGNLQNIAEAGIKSIDPLRSKGISRQVWEAVLDKAVTPITTTLGKVLYKTGDGLEFLGRKGAKTVRDILVNTETE